MRLPIVFLLLLYTQPQQAPSAQKAPKDMVLIPAGEFLMGSNEGNADEAPAHLVKVSAFYIDRYEVTNAAFAAFVRRSKGFDTVEGAWFRYSAEGCIDLISHYEKHYNIVLRSFTSDETKNDEGGRQKRVDVARWSAAVAALGQMSGVDPERLANERIAEIVSRPPVRNLMTRQSRFPVRGVTWRDAEAFARSVGKRLPTEAEWEKAARGTDGRLYPWGSTWAPERCRTGLEPAAGPGPVGSVPVGASPYGCLDMAGNVWEWVADWYDETYYASSESGVDPEGAKGLADGQLPAPSFGVDLLRSARQGRESNTRKVIRGGCWAGSQGQSRINVRCTRRLWSNPSYWHPDVGFRCAKEAK